MERNEKSIRLPKRLISNHSELTEKEAIFLDCYILRLCSPRMLFQALLAPVDSEKKSLAKMQLLLKNGDAIEYIANRKYQLEQYYFGDAPVDVGENTGNTLSQSDTKAIIIDKISKDIINAIKNDSLDYKQSAIIEKFMNKVLDYDEGGAEKQEPPRIYLPETCSHCRYRIAIEESDNVIDECKYCRYRQDSISRGIEYGPKEQLNL